MVQLFSNFDFRKSYWNSYVGILQRSGTERLKYRDFFIATYFAVSMAIIFLDNNFVVWKLGSDATQSIHLCLVTSRISSFCLMFFISSPKPTLIINLKKFKLI